MKKFVRLTQVDGHDMIIDLDQIQVFEQTNNFTLVHFDNGRLIHFRNHIDHIFEMINSLSEVAQ